MMEIDRNKKTFRETKFVRLDDGPLTIKKLAKVVGDNKFSIVPVGWDDGGGYVVNIDVMRLETDKELEERLAQIERVFGREITKG